jgi:hypothetical protein
MQYPLTFTFTFLTLGSKVTVTDATGKIIFFVQRKAFKLKEDIRVYNDIDKTQEICSIKAQNWIDWSGLYDFATPDGTPLGAVRRRGMKSMWKATYEILQNNAIDFVFKEENPFAKVVDNILGEIPIVGIFTGMMFNPKYVVLDKNEQVVMRLIKRRSMTESNFTLDKIQDFAQTEADEFRVLLGVFTALILEKNRG